MWPAVREALAAIFFLKQQSDQTAPARGFTRSQTNMSSNEAGEEVIESVFTTSNADVLRAEEIEEACVKIFGSLKEEHLRQLCFASRLRQRVVLFLLVEGGDLDVELILPAQLISRGYTLTGGQIDLLLRKKTDEFFIFLDYGPLQLKAGFLVSQNFCRYFYSPPIDLIKDPRQLFAKDFLELCESHPSMIPFLVDCVLNNHNGYLWIRGCIRAMKCTLSWVSDVSKPRELNECLPVVYDNLTNGIREEYNLTLKSLPTPNQRPH